MKNPILLFLAIVLAITTCFTLSLSTGRSILQNEQQSYENEEPEKETGVEKQLAMWFHSKGYPNPVNLDDKYKAAWQQYLEIKKKNTKFNTRIEAANWTSLGQSLNSGVPIGGRILCMAIDPNNANNLWVGSASGGIWRSTNQGSSWTPVTTNLNLLGVTSILIDPSNSNVIYAGTGEMYNTEVQVMGHNVWKTRGTYGIGIIKSTNGGATWSQVMVKSTDQLFTIQTMKFDPTNSNTIYACASDGLYRSTNNGTTWSQILVKTYVKDIAINPSNTDQIVVSIGNMLNSDKGIYRTTNGNNASPTWVKITSGLPASFDGYIRLDNVGASALMASIGISSSTAASNREIYSSSDFGANWAVVGGTTSGTTTNHCSFQFWFAHTVAINPFATDSIMFGGVNIYRYRLSNTTRTTISGLHSDHHDIVFDPSQRGRIYVCNDGGVYKSTNGGSSFTAMNTGLNATQFYASLGVSASNANKMVGGLQDNGQVMYNGTAWNQITWVGGDGTACAIDPGNDNNLLVSRDARAVYKSANGGTSGGQVADYWGFVADSRTGFVAPLAYSKSNTSVIYLGSDNLHKSTNGATTGTSSFTFNAYGSATNYIDAQRKTAITLAVSPTNSNKLYASVSPFAQADNDVNTIYITGATNVLKTTTGNTPFSSIKGTLPDRFVMDFAISNNNDDSVYIVLGGFGTSHVYLTPDGGTTWISRGAGLPDVPFNAIVIDPVDPKIIYAGCDFGVYVSPDRGLTWYDYNNGFWDATLVMDLQIDANNKLIAATHGKGVFRSDLFSLPTLPATLLDFNGTGYSGYNRLQWKVSQEENLSRYELERSTDGFVYTSVATVPSQNQTAVTTYSHQDNTNLFETYYRLKIIDIDGRFIYSSVVFIRKSGVKDEFSVMGNPFNKEIILKYKIASSKKIVVQLYNTAGSLVRKEEYVTTPGSGLYTITGFQNLNSGIYFLKINSGGDQQTIRLLKN